MMDYANGLRFRAAAGKSTLRTTETRLAADLRVTKAAQLVSLIMPTASIQAWTAFSLKRW
ncbi:hypothetical protein GWG65_19795 [Bradyrhizobium sp. CSA207]|uniref:hypothetical protein n=1 Tax=Bradyrhizobium sp. CSA207 TaxID=2698826 RepID=UPI0023B007F4|nr:hypothetical protein [Bradyrhizobium sp. CSA207]MDE5443647.1 hypothetical protein [Bradyrhizobium sp. CSA207]